MFPDDTRKQRIQAGEMYSSLQVDVNFDGNQLKDAVGDGDYDYVYVDGQHTAFNETQLAAFTGTAEDMGLPVMFRIPHTRHTYLIGRYLDLGVSSIMVPEVETAEVAEEAIQFFYYPQVGRRSWGGAARRGVRAHDNQVSRLEYAAWWNKTGVLGIQIECVDAVLNVAEIARPGIDYVSFGPNDLQFSLEATPDSPFDTVDDCYKYVAEQLQGRDVAVATPTLMPS